MGIGGPMGGLITDLFVSPFITPIVYAPLKLIRFGWRWAFLVQIPAFILSFVLISHNLTYVTVVSKPVITQVVLRSRVFFCARDKERISVRSQNALIMEAPFCFLQLYGPVLRMWLFLKLQT